MGIIHNSIDVAMAVCVGNRHRFADGLLESGEKHPLDQVEGNKHNEPQAGTLA